MKKISAFILDSIKLIIISVVLVYIITHYFFLAVYVDGNSMAPTLHDKSYGLSFIITKNIAIKRGDIAVIENEDTELKIVKRVIGLPGETIECRNSNIFINGEMLEEDYLPVGTITTDFSEVKLKDNEYYCLGDNRINSRDSRYYGSFKREEFVSTHILILLPLSEFGFK